MNFLKNTQKLKNYNGSLFNKLEKHLIDSPVEFIQSKSNDTNLLYKGFPLHCTVNPQTEAISALNNINVSNENSLIVLIGLGLGYLFKRTFIGTTSKIIIFEPDLNILKLTLEAVDFSEELNSERVYITSNLTELREAFLKSYSHNSQISLLGLKSAQIIYPDLINEITGLLPNLINDAEVNFNTILKSSIFWGYAGVNNFKNYKKYNSVAVMENKFKDKTALIIAAGPSLDENLELIKQNRDKFIIFCVNVVYKKLLDNGIIPDFTVCVDTYDVSFTFMNADCSKTNFILQAITTPEVYKMNAREKLVFYSENDLISRWISKIANFNLGDYETRTSSSYCAMFSAFKMGCNPIILVGQDLSYSEDKIYAAGTFHSDKMSFKFNNDENFLNSTITEQNVLFKSHYEAFLKDTIKTTNQQGKEVYTNKSYLSFAAQLECFALNHTSLKLINTSTNGLNINGFENLELHQIVSSLPLLSTNVNSEIDMSLSLTPNPLITNANTVDTNIHNLKQDIKTVLPEIKLATELLTELNKEFKKTHIKNLNKISKLAKNINSIYCNYEKTLLDKYEILKLFSFKELNDLNKMFNGNSQGLELFKEFNDLFSVFFNRLLKILTDIIVILER